MSILGVNPQLILTWVILIAIPAVCLPLAISLRVWRAKNVLGPERLEPNQPAAGLAVAFFLGFCAYFFIGGIYAAWRHLGLGDGKGHIIQAGVDDSAFLYSVPTMASALVPYFADRMIGGRALIYRLGLDPRRLLTGLRQGVIAAVVIIPPTYLVMMLSELVYRRLQFRHPQEHDLLQKLTEPASTPHPWAHFILIVSATFIAPFCEEFLFRGHLQTLFRRMLVVISTPPQPLPAFEVKLLGEGPLPEVSSAMAKRVLPQPIWQTWVAIVFTSILFAAMHPMWMWPPIFFLSLGLGYCYERTGKLWSNMLVHCVFNSVSTFVYLSSV